MKNFLSAAIAVSLFAVSVSHSCPVMASDTLRVHNTVLPVMFGRECNVVAEFCIESSAPGEKTLDGIRVTVDGLPYDAFRNVSLVYTGTMSALYSRTTSYVIKDAFYRMGASQRIYCDPGYAVLKSSARPVPGEVFSLPAGQKLVKGKNWFYVSVSVDEKYVDDISAFYGKPILSNVSGDGHFSILTDEINPLYKLYTYTLDNNIYVETVRETDYAKIFKNDVGNFLNDLRNSQSDNKLLLKLDNATSLAEMDEIMSASVRLNPLKLMDVVNVFNMFEINEISNVSDRISVSPIFIFSNDFTISGLSFNADYGFYKNLRAGLSLYSAKAKIKSDIEDYESALYGGNVHIAYFDDLLMARAIAGIANAKFDIGSVFDGTNTVMDPSGKSYYYVADMGFNFNVSKRFFIAPFMRVGLNSLKLLNNSDKSAITGVGADLLFDASMYDIEYKYGLNVSTYTNEQINAAFKIDINSVADKAGGYLNLGLVYDELKRVGYKIQVGVNFKL